MQNGESHDRNKANQFLGESDADGILEFLNGRPLEGQERLAAKSKARVLELISDLRNLLNCVGATWDGKLTKELSDQFQSVNLRLTKYPTFPIFYPKEDSPRRWNVDDALWGKRSVVESVAVHALVRLANQGLLERLQLCQCGLWYFGRFSHQRFCSAECRVRFWESSEERKEQKRQRSRENYLYHKVHKKNSRQKTERGKGA
jgi:hypothetical protein